MHLSYGHEYISGNWNRQKCSSYEPYLRKNDSLKGTLSFLPRAFSYQTKISCQQSINCCLLFQTWRHNERKVPLLINMDLWISQWEWHVLFCSLLSIHLLWLAGKSSVYIKIPADVPEMFMKRNVLVKLDCLFSVTFPQSRWCA